MSRANLNDPRNPKVVKEKRFSIHDAFEGNNLISSFFFSAAISDIIIIFVLIHENVPDY